MNAPGGGWSGPGGGRPGWDDDGSGSAGGWPQWDDGKAGTPPHPGATHHAPGADRGSSADLTGLGRLVSRHFVIPAVAVLVVIAGAVIAFATSGGTPVTNSASDDELCSAYRAAERSWDSYSTDATEINSLGAVARRHSDEDIRAAGKRLGDLSGMFSYGQYASIVRPIEYQC